MNRSRQHKDISFNNVTFRIYYNDSNTLPSEINSVNAIRLIEVVVRPILNITETQCRKLFDTHKSQIMVEVKKIIQENIEFYKNFDVTYEFSSEGIQIDSRTKALIEFRKRLNIGIKKE